MKIILCVLFALLSFEALGCICMTVPLMDYYGQSAFIATVKVTEVTPDREHRSPEGDYHYLKVEVVQLYKGKAVPFIRVNMASNSSCAFEVLKSTWLIFASMGDNDVPVFGACSGSLQIDRDLEDARYPRAAANYKRSLELKQEVLSYLKKNELEKVNPYNLTLFDIGLHKTNAFKGFDNQNRFAVYELDINEDLSIEKITALQSFDNPKLAQLFSEHLRINARVNTTFRKSIPTKTKLIVFYYYYPAVGNDLSFVSRIDV
jgi:hypothetical protein